MSKRGVSLIVLGVIVAMSMCSSAYCGDEQGDNDQWNTQFTPYFWAAAVKGDATLRGRTGSVDAGFDDIWDNLDFALMGRVETWNDRWGLFFDGLYIDLGADFSTPGGLVSADADHKQTILDYGIGRRIFEEPVGPDQEQNLSGDLFLGGRYVRLETEIDIVTNGPLSDIISGRNFTKDVDWHEVFVGGRLRLDLNDEFAVVVRGDVGGFGIGSSSDLTWNLLGGIDWRLSQNISFKVGYRIMDINYEQGSGNKEFGYDVQYTGPIFGLTILF